MSFNSATTGSANISNAQIANSGQSFDPAAFGFPAVADSFSSNYDNAVTAVAGLLSTINAHNTYKVTGATAASLLPTGTLIPRNFKTNEFESTFRIHGASDRILLSPSDSGTPCWECPMK